MNLYALKRQQILKAATAEFTHNGFQGTSMDAIAERANVSKRTVYNHFAGKEDLFVTVINDFIERPEFTNPAQYEPGLDITEQLLLFARQEIEILVSAEVQQYGRMLFGEMIRNQELARLFEQHRPSCQAHFIDWMLAAIADGAIRVENPELAAEQFFGLLKTLVFWPRLILQAQLTARDKEQAAISTVEMFLNTYRA